MTDARATVVSGTASQPDRFVVYEGETLDAGQASGCWISSDGVVEIDQ